MSDITRKSTRINKPDLFSKQETSTKAETSAKPETSTKVKTSNKPEDEMFRTPIRTKTEQEDIHFTSTPEGKEKLEETKKNNPAMDVKQAKQETIRTAKNDETLSYLITTKTKKVKGKGIKCIIIPPNKKDKYNRLSCLLGSNNSNLLPEYTAILDSLMKEGTIDKSKYKYFLNKFMEAK